jgi:ankyrin repeat protein
MLVLLLLDIPARDPQQLVNQLVTAAHAGDDDAVAQALDAGADVNGRLDTQDVREWSSQTVQKESVTELTALHTAAMSRNERVRDVMSLLLAAGANIDEVATIPTPDGPVHGVTPLSTAVMCRSAEAVEFLLESGSDFRIKTVDGLTALDIAEGMQDVGLSLEDLDQLEYSHLSVEDLRTVPDTIAHLLKRWTNDHPDGPQRGEEWWNMALRSLIVAAGKGEIEKVAVLLDKGVNPNAMASSTGGPGTAALHVAAQKGYIGVMDRLLAVGADVNQIAMDHGVTALMLASVSGQTEAIQFLLNEGADWRIQDIQGRTALGAAKAKGWSMAVEALEDWIDAHTDGPTQVNFPVEEENADRSMETMLREYGVMPDPAVIERQRQERRDRENSIERQRQERRGPESSTGDFYEISLRETDAVKGLRNCENTSSPDTPESAWIPSILRDSSVHTTIALLTSVLPCVAILLNGSGAWRSLEDLRKNWRGDHMTDQPSTTAAACRKAVETISAAAAAHEAEADAQDDMLNDLIMSDRESKQKFVDNREQALKARDAGFPIPVRRVGDIECKSRKQKLHKSVPVEGPLGRSALQDLVVSQWHPMKVVINGGVGVETVNRNDAMMQQMQQAYPDMGVADFVLNVWQELQQFNPSGGYTVEVPWNLESNRELTPAEVTMILMKGKRRGTR